MNESRRRTRRGIRRKAWALLKKTGRILRALFIKLGRLIGHGVRIAARRAYQFLTSLPPRTLLVGIGAMSLVLVSVLVLVLALPRKAPVQEAVGGDRSAQPSATNVPILVDDPAAQQSGDTQPADAQTGEPGDDPAEPSSVADTPAEPTATPFAALEKGDDGETILAIQTRLMDLGYMDSDEPTEHFGPLTESAIKSFQRHNGLTADGVIGE